MKDWSPVSAVRWLFASEPGATNGLLPRWIFLRALGLIYYSAFFSLVFQIKGLIGPQGILPAGEYLHAVTGQFGRVGYWYAPTLLWLSSGRHMLTAICWVGMIASLLVAGFISLFFAPGGFRPRLGEPSPPSRASWFLLLWECFRIYFESGVAKIMGGDPQWRNFTALDEYYQNGPLPTWIGWYMQHGPHWFHAATS